MKGRYRTPAKTRVSITIREDLRRLAREEGVNISAIAEEALDRALLDARRRRFYEENKEAIEAYNARIAREGLWSEKYRRF